MAAGDWWRSGPFLEPGIRRDAGHILRAGIAAADPEVAVRDALRRRAAEVQAARRTYVLALGKAADAMARGAVAALGTDLTGGLVVGPAGGEAVDGRLTRLSGDHPLPGPASRSAGEAVHALAEAATAGDLVVCLISGGASALVVRPVAGVTLQDLVVVTEALLRSGASIAEVNTVRRRLDTLKGGGLAAALAPASVVGLLVSDVPDDRPADIASGPLVRDPTPAAEAREVLAQRGLWDSAPAGVRRALARGTRGAADRSIIDLEIVASAGHALSGAAAAAGALGYSVDADPGHVAGEARTLGERLARMISGGTGRRAILRAGETTVTVRGTGRGGRNQEVALGAVHGLAGHEGRVVAAMGTDGIDGPTDAAGAVTDGSTEQRAATLGLDPAAVLHENDAWRFFDALGDLIRSGPTGTNVMDLYVAIAAG